MSYIQSSSVIDEYTAAALADGCTYYMDERDKEWLDRNNEEARGEGTSAQGSVLTSSGRVSGRSAKGKGKESEDAQPSLMSEDEFELVMGLFEKITQEKTEFLHHVRLSYLPNFFFVDANTVLRVLSQVKCTFLSSQNTKKSYLYLYRLPLLLRTPLQHGYLNLLICFVSHVLYTRTGRNGV